MYHFLWNGCNPHWEGKYIYLPGRTCDRHADLALVRGFEMWTCVVACRQWWQVRGERGTRPVKPGMHVAGSGESLGPYRPDAF